MNWAAQPSNQRCCRSQTRWWWPLGTTAFLNFSETPEKNFKNLYLEEALSPRRRRSVEDVKSSVSMLLEKGETLRPSDFVLPLTSIESSDARIT